MYSRVKRKRRHVKRDMYGVPIPSENEEEKSQSSSSSSEESSGKYKIHGLHSLPKE